MTLVGSALLVDPAAYASFDAPKRLGALVGACVAAFAAFAITPRAGRVREWWRVLPPAARLALFAAAGGLLWFALAAFLSPRRPASLDSLRAVVLYGLLVPLGASRAVARGRGLLVTAFLSATAVNAALSLLQSRGIQPFRLETFGTRNETGALAGNVGYLALALALGAVLSVGLGLSRRRPLVRGLAAAAFLLFAAALLVSRNLTALFSLAAGSVVVLVALFGKRSLVPIGAAAAALALSVVVVAPLRQRAAEVVRSARAGDWDRLTTYRAGAWAAAVEMARERPLTGWGPGTYAAEFVPHRLKAELRAHRRFVNPLVTSSYSEAHCDYLQAFAETGIPGGLSVIVAAAALFAGLGRRAAASPEVRPEAAILLGILAAGAGAALAWFPLQRPISAAPLLLAAGRSWRLAAGLPDEVTSR